jgi:rRNA maturation endonuclease Nob1
MNEREETVTCANEGCGKPAEEDSRFCASCGLEWMLLRRDTREKPPAARMPR